MTVVTAFPKSGSARAERARAGSAVLEVDNLQTTFSTPEGAVSAVSGVSFTVNAGEAVGVVGESGSGKSQIFMSVMGLLASNGRATGSVKFRGQEILGLPLSQLNRDPRRAHVHDLPGPDDLAQSVSDASAGR